ncbi:3'(2'),5'-bisphosphate nucleotidase CysQ [Breoghania sp.]|uniref:3'(2'),5'-bisphosphate nucleotidase CysQ n=1 Tax=Breoghania sp. TaxID=2065378 RepID=UPI00261E5821|nr:3'(2'),5'-bisphosphate nucleotidase CysQ [Breoghania sp.]MDJ0930252.1 3'(2'),5'-bisphosphate nucleotidase CysQ [Breoghania sp.]
MLDADTTSAPSAAQDLELIADAARQARWLAMNYFGRDPRVWNKENNSPVTEADMALDDYLGRELRGARPGYGWLSEETTDNKEWLSHGRLFLVDPIDGTRAFIRGEEDWMVSVAVVEARRPIAAALYAPVVEDLYVATIGDGARLNGFLIAVNERSALAGVHVAGPRSLREREALLEAGINQEQPIRSLALCIALVAAGRRDAAIATARSHDWDLAAADLLVQEAGGQLTDLDGRALRYNRSDVRHPALIASSQVLRSALEAIVRNALEVEDTEPRASRVADCGAGLQAYAIQAR